MKIEMVQQFYLTLSNIKNKSNRVIRSRVDSCLGRRWLRPAVRHILPLRSSVRFSFSSTSLT
jgi:hypothetical protein